MNCLLGIETSCDDTAVAIVSRDQRILANCVSSQYEDHAPYMGVVPELASRAHLRNLPLVYQSAMAQAGVTLSDLAGVAVTRGPGLLGSLMVGVNFAKALAFGSGLPLLGVNHVRGHVAALFLEFGAIPLPALALIVSGGHTHLFHVDPDRNLTLLTKTRDDAAGEAFDKLSKMLGLGFPGGAIIDRLARGGDPGAFSFSFPRFSDGRHDYSFSGLKSACARYIEQDPRAFADPESINVRNLCASFRAAVVHQLLHRVKLGLTKEPVRALLLGGGVACNQGLREGLRVLAAQQGLPAFLTAPALSTDNAAMIAAEGWRLFDRQQFMDISAAADVRLCPWDAVRLV